MESINETLSSPLWWVSVFIAGILTSVVGSYVRSLVDKWMMKTTKQWKSTRGKRLERKNKLIECLSYCADPEAEANRHAIIVMLSGIFMLVFAPQLLFLRNLTTIHVEAEPAIFDLAFTIFSFVYYFVLMVGSVLLMLKGLSTSLMGHAAFDLKMKRMIEAKPISEHTDTKENT